MARRPREARGAPGSASQHLWLLVSLQQRRRGGDAIHEEALKELPRSLQPFPASAFRSGMAEHGPRPPTTGRLAPPRLPSSPSEEATWVLPFGTLHLATSGPSAFGESPGWRTGRRRGPRDGGCAPRAVGCRGLAGSLTSRGRAREDL